MKIKKTFKLINVDSKSKQKVSLNILTFAKNMPPYITVEDDKGKIAASLDGKQLKMFCTNTLNTIEYFEGK